MDQSIYAVAIIPAKGSSTRLPGKNKKEIGGKSLVEISIDYARSCSAVKEIYVSTDDAEIAAIATRAGATPVERPEHLLGEAEVADIYVDLLQKIDHPVITHIIGLQPDHPDRQVKLNDVLNYFITKKYMDLVTVDSTGTRNGSIRVLKADFVRQGHMSRRVGAILDDCTNVEHQWQLERAAKRMLMPKLASKYIEGLRDQNKLNISIDLSQDFSFKLGGRVVGRDRLIIAGPCSVESKESIVDIAQQLKRLGVHALRGGAYKPTTFPILEEKNGWKEGLKEKGLEYLAHARIEADMPVVTEVMDVRLLEKIATYADVLQVGMRNFQNYTLLDELGKIDKPVLLKRGTWGTIDEILGAAERILVGGNRKVMICLRGVIGMPNYRHVFPSIRWAPDLMMILALKELTNLPIIYDPSHATGYRKFVPGIAKAALTLGADGLIIECHPRPTESISDADQAIDLEAMADIMAFARNLPA